MIFAISIGSRCGTASSEALITPVEYSVVISEDAEHADRQLTEPDAGAEDESDRIER